MLCEETLLTLRSEKKKTAKPKSKIRVVSGKRNWKDRAATRSVFDKSKTMMSLDYIFGKRVSKKIDFTNITFVHSRKTGRIKQMEETNSGKILFTFRPNGTIAPSLLGARMLLSERTNPRFDCSNGD